MPHSYPMEDLEQEPWYFAPKFCTYSLQDSARLNIDMVL